MTLKEAPRLETRGDRIAALATSFLCIDADAPVHSILEELNEPYSGAVAVVDARLRVLGLITPEHLVELLGKPFGRDLLQRQSAREIMRPVARFRADEYIAEVTERARGDFERDTVSHYALTGPDGAFAGHVSSQDLLHRAVMDRQREMAMATTIQGRVVPPFLSLKGRQVSIVCSSVMAQGVGGDYYHVREYERGKWFFCLCDISGKGISAAIITAVLAGFMHNADFSRPVGDLVAKLNALVLDTFKLEKYLTGFFARFSEATGEIEYCDMGHSWFFAVESGTLHQIGEQADNCPVGLSEIAQPVAKTLRISPGTTFLLISDGFVEQENGTGKTFPLETMGLAIADASSRGEDTARAKVRILESFFTFKREVPQRDDISMLIFEYREEPH